MAKALDKNLKKLPLGAIRPTGWLLDQMKLMNNLQKRLGALQGLVKNGEWESGENLPRYVRGVLLLSAALDDKLLKDKATGYLQSILNSAREGGDFGPKGIRSLTPKIEAVKTLLTYYEYTGEERVLHFLKKFFKNQYNTFNVSPCWYDSRARLLEEITALEAVYRETDLEWLHDLGEKLRDRCTEWFKLADKFPYKRPASKYVSQGSLKRLLKTVNAYEKVEPTSSRKLKPLTPDLIEKKWKKQQTAVQLDGVNLAKAVKYPATYGRFIGDDSLKNLSLKLIHQLMKYHSTAAGMFTCDLRLAGDDPSKGVDVQASVEMIESLVEVISQTRDYSCVDRLERIVFNVISAACLDDCSAVQDLVLVNQVEASDARKYPSIEAAYSNAFLTKKLSRGAVAALSAYPLFMQATCMLKDNEVNFLAYAPCTMNFTVDGCKLTISEKTGYPFRNTVVFKVEQASGEPEVKINFRVPKNVSMQLISGGEVVATGTKEISVKCVLRTGSTFMLKMAIPLTVEENSDGSCSLFKGNVLMSVKLPYSVEEDSQDRRILNIYTDKKWNVAPVLSRRAPGGTRTLYEPETTVVHDLKEKPLNLEEPPFELQIRAKNVLNWGFGVQSFLEFPRKPEFSEESLERTFIPFGCEPLHIAQFPKCLK